MKFQGAVLKEQDISFALVVVKMNILQSPDLREKSLERFRGLFDQMPIILMAEDLRGSVKYFGRSDIVKFLATKKLSQIPWKEYTTS